MCPLFQFVYTLVHYITPALYTALYISSPSLRSELLSSVNFIAQPAPALLIHFTVPSSLPMTNAPAEPWTGGCGLHETAQTSPDSCVVETAVRDAISHTLTVLSEELKKDVRFCIQEKVVQCRLTQTMLIVRLGRLPY